MANTMRFPTNHFQSLLMNHWYTALRAGVLDYSVGDDVIVINISNDDTLQTRVTKIEAITINNLNYQHAYMTGCVSVVELIGRLKKHNPLLKPTDVFTLITLVAHNG